MTSRAWFVRLSSVAATIVAAVAGCTTSGDGTDTAATSGARTDLAATRLV